MARSSDPSCTTLVARVLYADTDMMGIASHVSYLRWLEAGRAEYMRRRGCSYLSIEERGIQLPVVEAHLSYHFPARYDDSLSVRTRVGDLGRAQVRFDYEILRRGDLLADGYTRHAAVDRGGRVTRLPGDLRETLSAPEGASGEPSDLADVRSEDLGPSTGG